MRRKPVFFSEPLFDVAQVVGAGYGMSQETGDAATVVRMVRVAMLLPVVFAVLLRALGAVEGDKATAHVSRPPLLPWFAVAFALLPDQQHWVGAAVCSDNRQRCFALVPYRRNCRDQG